MANGWPRGNPVLLKPQVERLKQIFSCSFVQAALPKRSRDAMVLSTQLRLLPPESPGAMAAP